MSTIFQGDTPTFRLTIKNSDGSTFDPSGATYLMSFHKPGNSQGNTVASIAGTINALIVEFPMSASVSGLLTQGSYIVQVVRNLGSTTFTVYKDQLLVQ